jgi:uncharacterized protein (DUF2236 family)
MCRRRVAGEALALEPDGQLTGTVQPRSSDDHVPPEVGDAICALGYAAAGANVIMQLSRLPVGRAVAMSDVDSGRVDRHPIKRLRTTSAYLAVAMLGTDADRQAMRSEVDRAHSTVRSDPSDPVPYNAFDPELQLWVGACLYKGLEDIYELLYGQPTAETTGVLYRHGKRLGTTLQVSEEMWPADRAAFEDYWTRSLAQIEMDEITRPYLQGIAGLEFLGAPLGPLGKPIGWTLGPLGRLLAVGFLPEPFRDELGLPWSARRQRIFDRLTRAAARVTVGLPRPLRQFPFNAYLADTRRRIRAGRPIV